MALRDEKMRLGKTCDVIYGTSRNILYLISDGVIVAVVTRRTAEDPKLALVEGRGCSVHRIHLRNLLPLVRQAGHQLPAVGVWPPKPVKTVDNISTFIKCKIM